MVQPNGEHCPGTFTAPESSLPFSHFEKSEKSTQQQQQPSLPEHLQRKTMKVCPRVQCQGAYTRLEAENERLSADLRYVLDWIDPDEWCSEHAPNFNEITGTDCQDKDCEWCRFHERMKAEGLTE